MIVAVSKSSQRMLTWKTKTGHVFLHDSFSWTSYVVSSGISTVNFMQLQLGQELAINTSSLFLVKDCDLDRNRYLNNGINPSKVRLTVTILRMGLNGDFSHFVFKYDLAYTNMSSINDNSMDS